MKTNKILWMFSTLLTSSLLTLNAFAWTPAIDDATAKAIVDGVYRRGPDVPTSMNLNLALKAGAFVAGAKTVELYAGEANCLSDWLNKPNEFATLGSRPTLLAVAGQSDFAKAHEQRP